MIKIDKEQLYPTVNTKKGVVLTGRAPIWLYCYLLHEYHVARWVATYDPRIGKAIVVQTHDKWARIGDLIDLKED